MNDRKRLLIMLPILAIAAWLAIFGDKQPAGGDVAAPVARGDTASGRVQPSANAGDMLAVPPAAASAAAASPARQNVVAALNEPSPKNLFPSMAPPPPPPQAAPVNEEDMAPPPPQFRAIGSMVNGGRLVVFLDRNEQTFVATPGAVIDGFRVDAVRPNEVQLFDLSNKTKQIIPIEGEK